MNITEYVKKKLSEGETDFDMNLSVTPNGKILVDPNGIHNMKFNVSQWRASPPQIKIKAEEK